MSEAKIIEHNLYCADLDSVNLMQLEHAAFFTPVGRHKIWQDQVDWGAKLLKWWKPGSGKTERSEQFADSVAAPFFAFDASIGEGGLGAIPVPDMEAGVLRFMPADFVVEKFQGKQALGYVLVDDVTTFSPGLQPYLLALLLNKRLGSTYLSPRTRIMGATNEAADAPGGFDLAPAVANRPCHVLWRDPTEEEFADYTIKLPGEFDFASHKKVKPIDALAEEKRVLREWPEAMAWAVGMVNGFHYAKRGSLRQQPDYDDPKLGKAWGSPRTWVGSIRALASSRIHMLNEATKSAFVAGYIGAAAEAELCRYIEQMDIPDAAKFLDGEADFTHKQHRIDRTGVLIDSCVSLVIPENAKNRDARTKVFLAFLGDVGVEALDTITDVVTNKLMPAGLIDGFDEANRLLAKISPMVKHTNPKSQRRGRR